MKNMFSNASKYKFKLFSLRSFLLIFYLTFVLFSQIYAFFEIDNITLMFLIFFIVVIISFFISNSIILFFNSLNIYYSINEVGFNKKYFAVNFIFIFIIGIIIYNVKAFTGKLLFEPDFVYAMSQVKNNQYSAFSSPVFILLFAKLPMAICNNPVFISSFYIFIRSIVISYIITELSFNKLINIVLIVYYCFLPLSIHSEMTLMKDTPCAIFTAISILLIYKYHFLKKCDYKLDMIIALFLALANFMRLNAIVFSIPMIIVLFDVFNDRIVAYFRIFIAFISLLFIGNIVLPRCINIKENDPSWSMTEVMSIPATTVMAVAKFKPESLNKNENEYLKIICGENLEALVDFDEKIGWESVKFNKSIYFRSNIPSSYFDLANYTLDLLIREPKIVVRQIIRSTSSLYGYRYVGKKRSNPLSAIYYLFANVEVGFLFLILIASLIIKCSLFDSSRVNILIAIPIIIFSIVTALIIASPAITRYYLPLQMSVPIYVLYVFQSN